MVTLQADYTQLTAHPDAMTAFETAFTAAVASALGLAQSQVNRSMHFLGSTKSHGSPHTSFWYIAVICFPQAVLISGHLVPSLLHSPIHTFCHRVLILGNLLLYHSYPPFLSLVHTCQVSIVGSPQPGSIIVYAQVSAASPAAVPTLVTSLAALSAAPLQVREGQIERGQWLPSYRYRGKRHF